MVPQNILLTDFTTLKTSNNYITNHSQPFCRDDSIILNQNLDHLFNSIIFWDKIEILDDSGYGLGENKIIESNGQRFDIPIINNNPRLKHIINIKGAPRDFSIIDFIHIDSKKIKNDVLSISKSKTLKKIYTSTFKPIQRLKDVPEIKNLNLPEAYLPYLAQYYRTFIYMKESHEKGTIYSPHETRKFFLERLYKRYYQQYKQIRIKKIDKEIQKLIENSYVRCPHIDKMRTPSFLQIFISDGIDPSEYINEAFYWRKKFLRFRDQVYLKYIEAIQNDNATIQKPIENQIDSELKGLFEDYKNVSNNILHHLHPNPSILIDFIDFILERTSIKEFFSTISERKIKYDLNFLISYTKHAYSKDYNRFKLDKSLFDYYEVKTKRKKFF
jgi:hypothetical protein